jgi:FlaG/FlaF family flagellin (archaellin)
MTFERNKQRAISDLVATVLIIAVVMIASVAVGGFVFGIFGQSQSSAQVAVTPKDACNLERRKYFPL